MLNQSLFPVLTAILTTAITVYTVFSFVAVLRKRKKINPLLFYEKCAEQIIRLSFLLSIFLFVSPYLRSVLDEVAPFFSFYLAIVSLAAFSLAYTFSLMLKMGLSPKGSMSLNATAFVAYSLFILWSFYQELFNRPNMDWTKSTFQPTTTLQWFNTYGFYLLLLIPLSISLKYYSGIFMREVNSVIRWSLLFLLISILSTTLFFFLSAISDFLRHIGVEYHQELVIIVKDVLGLIATISSLIHVLGKETLYRLIKLWHFYKVREVQRVVYCLLGKPINNLSFFSVVAEPNYYLTEVTISIFDALQPLKESTKPNAQQLYGHLLESRITEGSLDESTLKLVAFSRAQRDVLQTIPISQ